MKKRFFSLSTGILLLVTSCSFTSKTFDKDSDKNKLIVDLINYILEEYHYAPANMDDELSKAIFDEYLEALDPFKRYFLAADIKTLKEKYYTDIDDQLKNLDISFFEETISVYKEKIERSKLFYSDILSNQLNFTKKEFLDADYENINYVKSEKELNNRWRKYLKYSVLTNLFNKKETEQHKAKQDSSYIIKKDTELIKDAQEEVENNLKEYFANIEDLKKEDWFASFINVYLERFDPHTFYFAPEDKEDFDVVISGKYQGIGIRFQKLINGVKVVEIISGGPVWKDNLIEVGDWIMEVAQENEEPIDVTSMPSKEIVKLIKGPKGTNVYLTIKRVDGTIDIVTIVRDKIELQETYLKTALVEYNNKTFGVINVPKFYVDFEDYEDSRNVASDMKKELETLSQNNIEGIVIDLRNNGGGSLKTVVDITGLFIKDGPVVQVKHSKNSVNILKDEDNSILWDKPLVIMVNQLSASASEILAAALQDYQRAIILGSKQSYGKGTVQNVVDMNRFIKNANGTKFGAMKVTTQKFYRINGGSTQIKGVRSDIVIPTRYSYMEIGEKDLERAMLWDSIKPANYSVWTKNHPINFEFLKKNSRQRISESEYTKGVDENAKWLKQQQERIQFPLDLVSYAKEEEEAEIHSKAFKKALEFKTDLVYNSLPYEEALFEEDTILKEKRKRWHKNLSKDFYVEEGIKILNDWTSLNLKNSVVDRQSN